MTKQEIIKTLDAIASEIDDLQETLESARHSCKKITNLLERMPSEVDEFTDEEKESP